MTEKRFRISEFDSENSSLMSEETSCTPLYNLSSLKAPDQRWQMRKKSSAFFSSTTALGADKLRDPIHKTQLDSRVFLEYVLYRICSLGADKLRDPIN
jgi:hypothetical protein